jgi:hypothetical protein
MTPIPTEGTFMCAVCGARHTMVVFKGDSGEKLIAASEVLYKAAGGPLFNETAFELAQNPSLALCAECSKPILPYTAVRAKADPQGRLWHLCCVPKEEA